MKIPKTFECNGFTWRVVYGDIEESKHQAYGLTVFRDQTIFIERSLNRQSKEQTFLHELLHVAVWASGLDQSVAAVKESEEAIVSSISNILFGLLKSTKII